MATRFTFFLLLVAAAFGSLYLVKSSRRLNLVFVTVDTLRADHTPFGGYSRETMPATAEFFRQAVQFDEAETPRSRTTPAYATIFTGLYPFHHGVRDLYFQLNPSLTTLAERLKEQGYVSAGFVSSFVMIGRVSGLQQGFDFYDDYVTEQRPNDTNFERKAPYTIERAIFWLKKRPKNKPFFLFIHLIDPHGPYVPPAPFGGKFHSSQTQLVRRDQIPNYTFVNQQLDIYQYLDRYDGEILYADSQLKRLYDALKAVEENTWFLFVADHGETLGEHEPYLSHGNSVFESESHVPLAWLPPTSLRNKYKAHTNTTPVSLVDIVPTVLDALQIKTSDQLDGRSLLPLMQEKTSENRTVFIERCTSSGNLFSIRDSHYKLIADVQPETTKYSLFDLSRDPNEQQSVITDICAAPHLKQALDEFVKSSRDYRTPFQVQEFPPEVRHKGHGRKEFIENRGNGLNEEDEGKMRALGYVD